MNTHLHRLAIAVLLLSGLLGVAPFSPAMNSPALEAQHRQFMLALLSAALLLSVFAPRLRLPAIVAALMSKLTFVVVALATAGIEPVAMQVWMETLLAAGLIAAGTVFWREERLEAHWNGATNLRAEA